MTKSAYDKMWASVVKKINLAAGGTARAPAVTGLTAHVFRHNYCTQLCYQIPKISIKKITQLLGDTEKMVIEVYNHIVEEQESPSEAIEDAVGFNEKNKDRIRTLWLKKISKGQKKTFTFQYLTYFSE